MNPTIKQIEVIKIISDNLGVDFKGTSKQEASQFISKYIEDSKRQSEQDSLYNELLGESLPNQ